MERAVVLLAGETPQTRRTHGNVGGMKPVVLGDGVWRAQRQPSQQPARQPACLAVARAGMLPR